MHSHFIPTLFADMIQKNNNLTADIVYKDGEKFISHEQGYIYPFLPEFYDMDVKRQRMDELGIDMSILSPAPPLFYYWTDKETSKYVAQMVNDELFNFINKDTKRFSMMATVPMNSVEYAIEELERIYRKSNGTVKFVEIGTNIEGELISNPKFEPFFAKVVELNMTVFLHPYYVGNKSGLENYYLTNLLGNPFDTTIAAVHLMLSGFINKFPSLKICLAHAGGFLPYQIGRLQHGYNVREEPKEKNKETPPLELLKRFYFDSITFEQKSLEFLVNIVGADKVMVGTDFPFDMGEYTIVEKMHNLHLSTENKEKIFHRNVTNLLSE